MKTNVFLIIFIKIIIVFTLFILGTLVLENCKDFFGDYEEIHNHSITCDEHCSILIDIKIGARHVWFSIGSVLIILLGFINLIVGIITVIQKNYDTSTWR